MVTTPSCPHDNPALLVDTGRGTRAATASGMLKRMLAEFDVSEDADDATPVTTLVGLLWVDGVPAAQGRTLSEVVQRVAEKLRAAEGGGAAAAAATAHDVLEVRPPHGGTDAVPWRYLGDPRGGDADTSTEVGVAAGAAGEHRVLLKRTKALSLGTLRALAADVDDAYGAGGDAPFVAPRDRSAGGALAIRVADAISALRSAIYRELLEYATLLGGEGAAAAAPGDRRALTDVLIALDLAGEVQLRELAPRFDAPEHAAAATVTVFNDVEVRGVDATSVALRPGAVGGTMYAPMPIPGRHHAGADAADAEGESESGLMTFARPATHLGAAQGVVVAYPAGARHACVRCDARVAAAALGGAADSVGRATPVATVVV